MNRFEGKVALVTGAARGIGRGVALELARGGANVVVNDFKNMDDAETVVQAIEAMGREAFSVQADVSDRDSVSAMVDTAVERFGALDIAVANAAYSVRQPILETSLENLTRTTEVAQYGTFNTCQLAARQMVKQALVDGSRGKIVITGSVHEENPFPNSAPYNMAKAAINHFARSLARELCAQRINVNVINPGWIDTPGERTLFSEEEIAKGGERLPWGRLGTPEDIAHAVAFFASREANYITGASLRVDGGFMVSLG